MGNDINPSNTEEFLVNMMFIIGGAFINAHIFGTIIELLQMFNWRLEKR